MNEEEKKFLTRILRDYFDKTKRSDEAIMCIKIAQELGLEEWKQMENDFNYFDPDILLLKINELFGVDVRQKSRNRDIAEARYIYWIYLRNRNFSYREIGKKTGHNYSTVMSGVKKIKMLIDVQDAKIVKKLNIVKNENIG
jgi:chromosomal replication initiation ATPase DnaA